MVQTGREVCMVWMWCVSRGCNFRSYSRKGVYIKKGNVYVLEGDLKADADLV